jgi:hypothetical protein
VEEPHYNTGESRRNNLCIATFILRIIGWPTVLEPASVLAPQSAETFSQVSLLSRVFRSLSRLEGADERNRTAFLLQLRVIGQTLQGVANPHFQAASSAPDCTVLRSWWCQSGVDRGNSCLTIALASL